MKFSIQWQIILGIIIGTSFGILFPTSYKITDNTIVEFQKTEYPPQISEILKLEKKEYFETKSEFLKRLKPALGSEYYEKYKNEILIKSKYNIYLPYVSWLGSIFLRILAMLGIPLVVSAIISSLSGIAGFRNLARLSLKTIFYYFTSSALAIAAGLILVNIIKPGIGFSLNTDIRIDGAFPGYSFKESIIDIIPTNIFDAFSGSNMISVIFFSMIFGYFTAHANDRSRIFIGNFFSSSFEVFMQISNFIKTIIPFGLIGITASIVAEQSGDLQNILNTYSIFKDFIITILIAFGFHAIVSLPLFMYIGFKVNPWKVFLKLRSAMVTAFFTSSTISSLPITLQNVNKNCGVSNKVSCFTLPLGATIRIDITLLYQIIAVFFIAQAYGFELNFIETIVAIATTFITTLAVSSIPMSGMYITTIALTAIGLPIEGLGMLILIDFPIGMIRSMVNVWSDSCCSILVAVSEGEELIL